MRREVSAQKGKSKIENFSRKEIQNKVEIQRVAVSVGMGCLAEGDLKRDSRGDKLFWGGVSPQSGVESPTDKAVGGQQCALSVLPIKHIVNVL